MADLDALAPNYRRAQRRWPDAPTLAKCHEALNACFAGNAHGMVEHVKSYIESVCLTIMGELREPMPSSTPSTTALLVAALRPLGMRNTKGASKLDSVLSAFNKLADALTEMRNDQGPVAHGKDAFLDAVTADHARAFLHAGDAILGVLLNAFEGKQPDLTVTREPYENFPHLNDRIDRAVNVEARVDEDEDRPIVVFSVATGAQEQQSSSVLNPAGCFTVLIVRPTSKCSGPPTLRRPKQRRRRKKGKNSRSARSRSRCRVSAPRQPTLTELVPTYGGNLEPLRAGVQGFLRAEGLESEAAEGGPRLIDSLLATAEQNMGLDWKQREPLQARLKVACKRVLVQFGTASDKAEDVAERFVGWLRIQAPEVEVGSQAAPVVAAGGLP